MSQENISEQIIEVLNKVGDDLDLKAKLSLTQYIIQFSSFISFEDFIEEECHLTLLNWIWKKNFISSNQNELLDLINNILIILDFLPIKSNDILGLKMFEKLSIIKSIFIKKFTCPFLVKKISLLLDKWKTIVEDFTEKKILSKKRCRCDEDTTDSDSSISLDNIKSSIKSSIKKKNINKVKFDLNANQTKPYHVDDSPIQISTDLK